ncbi:MAG: macro domain-containing protein [Nitriliruptor sp.]|nr:MAG: macro domain-containing protein [Nitriliruptor sp.]
MQHEFDGVTIELLRGDITDQPDIDAIVNAANAQLQIGGGVAGAIHRAAGPGLAEECAPLAPISPGECVLTAGHELPNPHVLHCLGPVYGVDEPSDTYLADCYRNALRIADDAGLTSVAFPAISTGAFGYPLEPATEVALTTIVHETANLTSVGLVRLVLFSPRDLEVHEQVLDRLAS